MPKVSRDTAEVEDVGVLVDRSGPLDGYTLNFLTFREDLDGTPLLKGAPGDQCQCPHWGYVLRGRLTYRVGDHEESFEAGEASTCTRATFRSETSPAASSCSSALPRSCSRPRP